MLVTKVERSALNYHRPSQLEAVHLDSYRNLVLQHTREELALLTEIEKRKTKEKSPLKKCLQL